jgi:hypothetical protein
LLIDNEFSRCIGHHGTWVCPAIGGMALLVELLASWWLGALMLTADRASDIRLTAARTKDEARRGRTTLAPSALVTAVTDEISDYHGITGARGRILGEASRPTRAFDVSAGRRADLPALIQRMQRIQRIQRDAVAHARSVLDKDEMRAIVNVSVNDKAVSRTR